MPAPRAFLAAILVIILVCILAALACRAGKEVVGGTQAGAPETKNHAAVVDTLNLVHWLQRRAPTRKVDTCAVLEAVEATAPALRARYGRVVYVTKNREARASPEDTARRRALFQAAARRCNVDIHVVERLPDEAGDVAQRVRAHSALGRDDFYLIMVAHKLRATVLSRDRFRDLADMKAGDLASFHVFSYSPARGWPDRDFVNPSAAEFKRMRRPDSLDFAGVLPHL